MGVSRSRQAGRGNHTTVLAPGHKTTQTRKLSWVRVEQSEQADYKNT